MSGIAGLDYDFLDRSFVILDHGVEVYRERSVADSMKGRLKTCRTFAVSMQTLRMMETIHALNTPGPVRERTLQSLSEGEALR